MRRRLAVAYALVIAACGSRTALVDDETAEFTDDASVSHKDGGDASRDADAQIKLDGAPDVFVNDCSDASVTFIYLISDARELYSYNPVDGNIRDIGTVNCPSSVANLSAFSMAVDRQGTAYVLMWDGQSSDTGEIFRVDTANASCKAIPEYAQNQQGFGVFGMGFATNGGGPSERLYVQGGDLRHELWARDHRHDDVRSLFHRQQQPRDLRRRAHRQPATTALRIFLFRERPDSSMSARSTSRPANCFRKLRWASAVPAEDLRSRFGAVTFIFSRRLSAARR